MNRRLALTLVVFALLCARRAAAQDVNIGYQGLPYKAAQDSKTGIALSEGVLLHLGAGAEFGYDSNVFYGSTSAGAVPNSVVGSGILRLNAYGEISNGSRMGGGSPSVGYDFHAGLLYRDYTSSDPRVTPYQNAYMPSAGLSLGTGVGSLGVQLMDAFIRTEDPPYQGLTSATPAPITRNSNLATLQGSWSPGGGRIATTLRYTNSLDLFDDDSGFSYANSVTHTLLLDVSWKWLPKTAIFLQASQGYISYLSSNTKGKVGSYPLHVVAGLRGLITPKISAVLSLGYANAFYSSGATTGGILGSSYIDAQVTYNPTLLGRITAGYHQDFQNSVISNFYYSYSAYVSYVQQVLGRLSVDISGRYSHLDYEGLLFDMSGNQRTDNTITGGITADYFFRSWIYAGVGYSLGADFSDYRLPVPPNAAPGTLGVPVNYTKQQVFARLGVTY